MSRYYHARRMVATPDMADLDLANKDGALAWARKHIPDAFPDPDSELPEAGAMVEMVEASIEEYTDLYNDVTERGHVQAYRAVRLKSISDLDTMKVGNYWSFELHGANQYQGPSDFGNIYVLTATVLASSIDWTHGFYSYVHYGSDQSEVAILPNTEVLVTHVDGKPLREPIKATTGAGTSYNYAI